MCVYLMDTCLKISPQKKVILFIMTFSAIKFIVQILPKDGQNSVGLI